MLQKTPVFGHTCVDISPKSFEVFHDLKKFNFIVHSRPRSWPKNTRFEKSPPQVGGIAWAGDSLKIFRPKILRLIFLSPRKFRLEIL